MSTDVRQWLDYRHYSNKPPLRQWFDYAIAPVEVINKEFDTFKAKLQGSGSFFPYSRIIAYWAVASQHPVSKVAMYGREYIEIGSSGIDGLAVWMKQARAAYELHGTDLFRYIITKNSYLLLSG